ncbi:MAG: hypothetical protein U9N53_10065 [Bacteroidota bacterium]|nr:hypothetical protein [Bacteroidota bacterium]
MRTAIKSILAVAILIVAYLLFESINDPIRFNREVKKRETATIKRLKDIRTAQTAYRAKYGEYTGSFDTLINFVKHDSFPFVKAIGSISDSLWDLGVTEKKALEMGIITRDTTYVHILDSLFVRGYPIDSLRYVPYCDTNQFFLGATDLVTVSKVKVKVFEANVLNNILLHGLNKQLIINYNAQREKIVGFMGLKVGSLEASTNNAGNWE